MDINLEKKLRSKQILDTKKILKMRQYIDAKYTTLSKKDRADMLSNTIHVILGNCLNNIDTSLLKDIKIDILKETLFKGKNEITYYDIFLTITLAKYKISSITIDKWLEFYFPVNKTTTSKIHTEDVDSKPLFNPISVVKPCKASFSAPIQNKKSSLNTKGISLILCSMIVLIVTGYSFKSIVHYKNISKQSSTSVKYKVLLSQNNEEIGIPSYLKYLDVEKHKLKRFLKNKNSLLEEEPYFSSIIASAKEFNLNPLILFAITGQEQSFVPKSQKKSKKIANNPFNVFHSWMEYNTDIKDSSRIAARTIYNLCKDKPSGQNPFKWINRKYAEDKNWHKGVESLYNEMLKELTKD